MLAPGSSQGPRSSLKGPTLHKLNNFYYVQALHSEIEEKAAQEKQDIETSLVQLKKFKAKNRDEFIQ